jgi:hypothetical protein
MHAAYNTLKTEEICTCIGHCRPIMGHMWYKMQYANRLQEKINRINLLLFLITAISGKLNHEKLRKLLREANGSVIPGGRFSALAPGDDWPNAEPCIPL